ncbi:hypothetical protein SDC9_149048 [bioreactor metagenome]|uniref:Uncharacterized protein n=1 Tax=bioreactor metagenome TaxID=1076179 RepID=A0A645EK61_9ZZZZ
MVFLIMLAVDFGLSKMYFNIVMIHFTKTGFILILIVIHLIMMDSTMKVGKVIMNLLNSI